MARQCRPRDSDDLDRLAAAHPEELVVGRWEDAVDLVALAREISGRDVELVIADDAAFMAGLLAAGLPHGAAELVTSFGAATRGGFLANVSSAVADLTGHTPTALAAVVRAALKS